MTQSTLSVRVLALALASAAAVGCADPEGEYQAFLDRAPEQQVVSCEGGSCAAPAVGAPDGDYLFVIASSLDATKPLLFDTQVTTSDDNGKTAITLSMQALQATDRQTLVGDRTPYGPYPLEADGTFVADLPPITVVLEANSLSAREIEADVVLEGRICDGVDFHFGSANGTVTKPISLDLTGSTWTLERLANPAEYPEPPKINCAGDLAAPVSEIDPQ